MTTATRTTTETTTRATRGDAPAKCAATPPIACRAGGELAAPMASTFRGCCSARERTRMSPRISRQMHVLIVDDDEETLGRWWPARCGATAIAFVAGDRPLSRRRERDRERRASIVIVLDVMRGRRAPGSICAPSCAAPELHTPILILSARGTVAARVDGLDAGATITSPSRSRCASSWPRSARSAGRGPSLRPTLVQVGAVRLDFTARKAFVAEREVPVTARECGSSCACWRTRTAGSSASTTSSTARGARCPKRHVRVWAVIMSRLRRSSRSTAIPRWLRHRPRPRLCAGERVMRRRPSVVQTVLRAYLLSVIAFAVATLAVGSATALLVMWSAATTPCGRAGADARRPSCETTRPTRDRRRTP